LDRFSFTEPNNLVMTLRPDRCFGNHSAPLNKLDTSADEHDVARSACDLIRKSWRALKAYRRRPIQRSKAVLPARFACIFTLETAFLTLDRLLVGLHKSSPGCSRCSTVARFRSKPAGWKMMFTLG
jgi:hypothetical protein